MVRKIRGFLSPRHNGGLDAIARVFHAHARGYVDYGEHSETIDELVDAIARHRVCRILYRAATAPASKEHSLKPLRLLWHRSALYFLALLEGRSDITTFAVQRIEALDASEETFSPPRAKVGEHTEKAFGIFVSDEEENVEILFDADIGWKIEERTFHPAEHKERLEDGRLRYAIRSSAQWEIIPWVLSYGAKAELVAPLSWRQALREDLSELSARYA